jgi:cytoskeletal protein RodZ
MQPLGKKLQEARLRKKISIEEASRVTKIRASRLQEIENEDFSNFSSLAYAKGFLLIYGKFLDVDVSPYLDAFETSREVSVDGYSYLQEAPATSPLPVARRQPTRRPTLMPLIIAVGVLVIGLYLVKLLLDIQRIAPRSGAPATAPLVSATPTATPTVTPIPAPSLTEEVIAPRAIPVEGTPAASEQLSAGPTATPVAAPSRGTEPQIRRAQPVHPEDFLPPPKGAATPPNETTSGLNQLNIKPVQVTYVRVMVDGNPTPVFNDWLEPAHAPLTLSGRHIIIRVLDRSAIQITKNGAALTVNDPDVTFE